MKCLGMIAQMQVVRALRPCLCQPQSVGRQRPRAGAPDSQSHRRCEVSQPKAERKAGKLLKAMEKHKGGRPSKKTGNTVLPVFDDLGITKNQSSRWQREAELDAAARPIPPGMVGHAGSVHPTDRLCGGEEARWLDDPGCCHRPGIISSAAGMGSTTRPNCFTSAPRSRPYSTGAIRTRPDQVFF